MTANDPPSRLRRRASQAGSRLRVHVCDARGRRRVVRGLEPWLARVVPRRFRGDVTVALVSDRAIRRLNQRHRGVDRPTDVLSFPASDEWRDGRRMGRPVSGEVRSNTFGDIVIATGVAARQARALGHSLGVELRVLALHGFLHLVGFDHERDCGEMQRVERTWRRRGGLATSLIERAERP